jgi:hypothetical protein
MKCCSFYWELPSQFSFDAARAAFGAVPSILLLKPTFNRNTQKSALLLRINLGKGEISEYVEYFSRLD